MAWPMSSSADGLAEVVAEVDVGPLGVGGLAAGHDAGRGELVGAVGGGVDQGDAFAGELVGDGEEDRVVALVAPQAGEPDA